MPTFNVQNNAVRANLRELMTMIAKEKGSDVEKQKKIKLMIHREKGLWQKDAAVDSQEWLPIELLLNLDLQEVTMHERESHRVVNLQQLSSVARRTLVATCLQIKKALFLASDLRELAYFAIPEKTDQSLLKEAWMEATRVEAEKWLQKAQAGSYLFRKDPFAACLQELLSRARKESVQCLTLTYIDEEEQVHDITIVQCEERWMFYDDDPTLKGDDFPSLTDLLLSLGGTLSQPLKRRSLLK